MFFSSNFLYVIVCVCLWALLPLNKSIYLSKLTPAKRDVTTVVSTW